ncbi:unnamed protein product [Linum tenue]|uniref:Transmembrane protein n=1 Tax=Linum tenue TaxID=586396 RepID=A0AAV0NA81_9ROSI|nr:unnamed protein product [Linum tenue]
MESTELITKDKLEFLGIIKESLKIPAKNPTFILLSFLTSLPAFCFFLWQHLVLHQLIYEAGVKTHWPLCSFPPRYSLDSTLGLIQRLAPTLALSAFSYLTIGHFLNVLNTIVLVHSASTIYAEKEAGSWYISRGCRGRGFLLMVVFLVWRVFLRMVFGYYGYLNKESGSMVVLIAVGEGGLVWFGEVVNWVVCTVYYYDCKRRFLEKKVDSEKQGGTNLV